MGELEPQIRKLRNAAHLLRKLKSEKAADAVGIIDDVVDELGGHDCDDYASECAECHNREFLEVEELPHVRECLELGLPALVEKYGWNSVEVRTAQEVIEAQQ